MPSCVPDWKDAAVLFCTALIVLGAVALSVSAQTFSIVQGQIVEKGIGVLQYEGKPRLTNTISVLIESDDRVFNIKRGTIVQYPVSEADAQALQVGARVEILVSAYAATVRVLNHPSAGSA